MQRRYSIKAIVLLGACLLALHFHPLRRIHILAGLVRPAAATENLLTWYR
ncbi:hypothetical protein [Dinghuibacter silviterrae]|uniref:Uncharacterized protein n=1 Tax=Dinghuibacter silviterrae TaxID=1539049 RepID=A0A4R8DTE5_9BACT|nr:hypothetical protein [Dinghuibacter silviterrae]TDX01188.1 hypothetical protein EDB95_2220 [Dinghuibacter silviterrae]